MDTNNQPQQRPPVNNTADSEVPSDSGPRIITPIPVVATTKRSRHTGVFILAMLLLVSLAGFAGYMVRDLDLLPKPGSRTSQKATSTAPAKDSEVKTDLKDLVLGASKLVDGGDVKNDHVAPYYKVSGYDFYTESLSDDATNITFKRSQTDAPSTMSKLENYLIEENFKKIASGPEVNYPQSTFENGDTVCGITYDDGEIRRGITDMSLACAYKTAYDTIAAKKKPFYEAYRTAEPEEAETMYLGVPRIIESRTQGYMMAEADLYSPGNPGGAMGLFYQTPDKKWHYFTGSQAKLSCSVFDTNDLKKAFAGEICTEGRSGLDGTVQ